MVNIFLLYLCVAVQTLMLLKNCHVCLCHFPSLFSMIPQNKQEHLPGLRFLLSLQLHLSDPEEQGKNFFVMLNYVIYIFIT